MPTFVAASKNVAGTGTTVSVNHTAGAGSNMLAIIDVAAFDNAEPSVSSVTYGGNACTLVRQDAHSSDTRERIARYYYVGPPNTSQAVVATFSVSSVVSYIYVHTYSDCDPTTPLGTTVYAADATTGPATANVSSAATELVADFVFTLASTVTVGAGQTSRQEDDDAGGNGFSLGTSTETGASTTTMSWTLGSASRWAIYASPIKPVSSGSTISPAQATLTINGRSVTTSAFQNVRIRDVLVSASGQAAGSLANVSLLVWYGGRPIGAPDVSLNGLTTDANGTASWSIATGTLAFNQAIFYVACGSDTSLSAWTCARMTPNYE